MKTKSLKLAAIALGAVAIAFTACKKIDVVEPTAESIGEATIQGYVYINTDQAEEDDDLERAGGASILVTYEGSELSTMSDGDSFTKSVTAKTDSKGYFKVSVPANYDGITYTVDADQYTSNYTVMETKTVEGEVKNYSVEKKGVFARQTTTVTIKTGQKQTIEFNYGSTPEVDLSK